MVQPNHPDWQDPAPRPPEPPEIDPPQPPTINPPNPPGIDPPQPPTINPPNPPGIDPPTPPMIDPPNAPIIDPEVRDQKKPGRLNEQPGVLEPESDPRSDEEPLTEFPFEKPPSGPPMPHDPIHPEIPAPNQPNLN